MTSSPVQFIKIQDQTVYSNCVEYRNDAEKIIHLIPVLHIGEESYYRDLIQYVGNKRCLYEYLKVDFEKLIDILPENFSMNSDYEEFLSVFKEINFYKINRLEFENMLENGLSDDINKLLNMAKEFSNHSEKSKLIFEICNSVFFSLDAMAVLQRYLSELMEMALQTQVIDYTGEIQNLPNWEHLDLDIQFDIEELNKPIDFTPEFIQAWSEQMNLILALYIGCLIFEEESDINLRRKQFVEQSVSIFTQSSTTEDLAAQLPDILVGVRDAIIEDFLSSSRSEGNEFAIFYGPAHLYTIENIIKSQGFQVIKETPIKIFDF